MNRPFDDWRLVVEPRGDGEWIVSSSAGGRPLHVYRVGVADWLVTEVGRGTEGRGEDAARALTALAAEALAPDWWSSVPAALDAEMSRDDE